MPGIPRGQQLTASACYHVMNRGHNRETVFDNDWAFFLKLLARYRDRFDLRLCWARIRARTTFGDPATKKSLAGWFVALVPHRRHERLEVRPGPQGVQVRIRCD
jgi:hypothetical protein